MRAASYLLTIEAAKTHLSALLNGRRTEAFAVLYLDSKNRLLGEDLWEGTIDKIHIAFFSHGISFYLRLEGLVFGLFFEDP